MRLTQFQGVVPKLRAEKLGQGFASFAENCLLHSGAIVPLVAPSFTADTVNIDGSLRTSPPGSLHRIGALWLGFDDFIPIAEDPIHVAGPDSFLYVKDGQLYRSGYQWIVDKQGPVKVGIDRPVTPPVATPTGEKCDTTDYTPDDCWQDVVNDGENCDPQIPPLPLSFCYTWVTACVEESGPSDYSEPVLVNPGEGLVLVAPDTPPENAVAIRWYMLMTDKDNAMMTLIGEQTLPALAFHFCPTLFAGNDPLISETWYPPRCAEGVANVGFGSALIWSGRDLYPSEVNQPHAYPERYKITVDDPIVRVISYRKHTGAYTAVVLTTGVPFMISGDTPDQLTVTRMNRTMPCVSAKSGLLVDNAVFFCSHEGIASIQEGNVQLVTTKWMDTAWWENAGPGNYILGHFDQRLFAFADTTDSRSFMFTLSRVDTAYEPRDLVFLTARATAVYADPETPMNLSGYGLGGAGVWRWEGSNTPMCARWQSRVFSAMGAWAPTACKVLTDAQRVSEEAMDYSRLIWEEERRLLTAAEVDDFLRRHPDAERLIPELVSPVVCVELLAYKEPVYTRHVWSMRPFRLRRKVRLVEWGISVTTTAQVYEIHMAHTIEDLAAEGGDA